MKEIIINENGKYEVVTDQHGEQWTILLYDEPYRSIDDDAVLIGLISRIEELELELKTLTTMSATTHQIQKGDRRCIDGKWLTCSDPEIGRWQGSGTSELDDNKRESFLNWLFLDQIEFDPDDLNKREIELASMAFYKQSEL